jgi:hypothetical protein
LCGHLRGHGLTVLLSRIKTPFLQIGMPWSVFYPALMPQMIWSKVFALDMETRLLILRGFYHGNKLKYDSAGMLAGNSPRRHRGACRFGQELAAVPGGSESGQDKDIATKIAGAPLVRIGKGVTPARVRSAPSPEFSTEARELHYQGTVTLWLVVDTDAEPRNIRIAKPLGMGLRKEDTRFAQRQSWRRIVADLEAKKTNAQNYPERLGLQMAKSFFIQRAGRWPARWHPSDGSRRVAPPLARP